MTKNKIITSIVILATLILAGIAVFTALRLYGRGSEPVSPAAPSSQPEAGRLPKACQALIFSLSEKMTPTPTTPSDQPTSTPKPTVSATPTTKPSNTPSPTPTDGIGGEPDPSPTATKTPTATPTQENAPSNDPTPTLTNTGGVGGTGEELPAAGNFMPTVIFGATSILFILLGLMLAF